MFYALSGFDSHPFSTKPGSQSMARFHFIYQKTLKLTHLHMGEDYSQSEQ